MRNREIPHTTDSVQDRGEGTLAKTTRECDLTISFEIFSHASYRTYLRAELSSRITRNPRYSLRAFAQTLDLSPSLLSRVLRGEQNFSEAMACQVATRLGLESQAFEYFAALVQYESASAMTVKARVQDRLGAIRERAGLSSSKVGEKCEAGSIGGFRDLSLDVFRCISDWFHIPLLEMTHLPAPFVLSSKTAAERLGISVVEAEAALERLERLELIEKDVKGRWKKSVENPWFRAQTPNSAVRAFHRAFLEKSLHALENQPPEERHFGTYSFVVEQKDLPRAQKKLDALAQEFVREFGASKNPENVYSLGFQMIRVSRDSGDSRNLKFTKISSTKKRTFKRRGKENEKK